MSKSVVQPRVAQNRRKREDWNSRVGGGHVSCCSKEIPRTNLANLSDYK
jgi:hypothetical protein